MAKKKSKKQAKKQTGARLNGAAHTAKKRLDAELKKLHSKKTKLETELKKINGQISAIKKF